ncbi:MAG: energy coupling factor transporter S component ThiW [Theionarchaea archaeon]|nr:energy coupling factor transporter S component ThiW [Theionarchaea archaeon]MBU7001911.1 energy coupling factor transporter S component ThiW [Theionarchaea archaeon]MBU7022180.1 energy coupling factor transporter S component ThiW [Theionarchaea archaeon]MBU7035429.1 energy coupling factor transporter S component ThiW [Theionarchaea archaeon]MBU7039700.1 energy coupling factor transporter S component ThiW [Theionarchaea archaeon]
MNTKLLSYIAIFGALGAALGWISIPVGPTRVFPLQHTINAISGVLIGPWAVVSSLIAATVRFSTGMGSIHAFSGSPFGALVVSLVYKLIKKDAAAFFEPVGTVCIGGTLSGLLIAPFITENAPTLWFFWTAFGASCIPGAILGYFILKILRRSNVEIYRASE